MILKSSTLRLEKIQDKALAKLREIIILLKKKEVLISAIFWYGSLVCGRGEDFDFDIVVITRGISSKKLSAKIKTILKDFKQTPSFEHKSLWLEKLTMNKGADGETVNLKEGCQPQLGALDIWFWPEKLFLDSLLKKGKAFNKICLHDNSQIKRLSLTPLIAQGILIFGKKKNGKFWQVLKKVNLTPKENWGSQPAWLFK